MRLTDKALSRSLVATMALAGLPIVSLPVSIAAAETPAVVSPWVSDHNVRLRLVGGGWPSPTSGKAYAAGIELDMAEGWKTYWRMPGASGVPPTFTWDGSTNVAKADVGLPAPRRFVDRDGDTIGYKGNVTFPVRITPVDPAKPVELHLSFELGVCKDICIPVQQTLSLSITPAALTASPGDSIKQAIDLVPRAASERRSGDPQLKAARAELTGDKPRLLFEAIYPDGAADADLFIEAPESAYVPLPKVTTAADGKLVSFEIDLTQGADIADLKGKELRLTFVGATGQSETTWVLK